MGLDDREYVRNDPRLGRQWSPTADAQVTRVLIVLNIVVFLAQMFSMQRQVVLVDGRPAVVRVSIVTDWLRMDYAAVREGQVWRLLTYAFCHSTAHIQHILFNMLVLWFFGRAVEALYGGREFLRFYLLSALVASLAYVFLGLIVGRGIAGMLGASGACAACFTVFACHYPRAQVRMFLVLPVEARWLLLFYVAVDMTPVVVQLAGGHVATGIAHSAHLGGLFFGLWYKYSGTRIGNWLGGWSLGGGSGASRPRSNPNVRIYEPTSEELKERVDALLDKIREQGEGSLTDQEREFLKEASRHYR